MAALALTTPTTTGVVVTAAAVSASDTIDQATLGAQGVFLKIINGNASSDTVTIKDFGTTRAGNSLASNQYTKSVTNGTSQVFWIRPEMVDPTTGLVTITHSVTATVTYEMYPVF